MRIDQDILELRKGTVRFQVATITLHKDVMKIRVDLKKKLPPLKVIPSKGYTSHSLFPLRTVLCSLWSIDEILED